MANKYTNDRSLVVANQKLTLGQSQFLRTDNGTALVNVNGLSAGAQLDVWDGSGAGDTGADWAPTGDGSEQPAADAGDGTNGWDTGAVGPNSNTDFDNGAEIDVANTYDTLTFKLQPKAYPNNAQFQIQWKNAVGAVIGQTLTIANYTANMDLDVWQQVQIPIADFNLSANVQRLNFSYKVGNQHHYLDDISMQAAGGGGGPFVFQVAAPDPVTRYHVSMLVLMMSAPAVGWNSTNFCDQPALASGLLLRQRKISTAEILWSINAQDNSDLFGRFHPQDDIEFADGTLLVGFMVKPGNASIVITDDEVLEVVVRDDLSGLTSARGFAHYGVEELVL